MGAAPVCWDIEDRSLRGLSDFIEGPTAFLVTHRAFAPLVRGEDGARGRTLLDSPLLHH